MTFAFNQYKYSSIAFKSQLEKLWEDNAASVNYFVQYSLQENEMTQHLGERLMNVQQNIGHLIGHFYGIKAKLADAFVRFMQCISEAIDTFKWKKNIEKFREKWYMKMDELIQILYMLSDWDLRNLFSQQISLIESLIKSIIKGDHDMQNNYYNQLVLLNRNISNIISDNIIKNKRNYFL